MHIKGMVNKEQINRRNTLQDTDYKSRAGTSCGRTCPLPDRQIVQINNLQTLIWEDGHGGFPHDQASPREDRGQDGQSDHRQRSDDKSACEGQAS